MSVINKFILQLQKKLIHFVQVHGRMLVITETGTKPTFEIDASINICNTVGKK